MFVYETMEPVLLIISGREEEWKRKSYKGCRIQNYFLLLRKFLTLKLIEDMALEFTDQTAREAIESGKAVVVDFWATWCGPCIKLGPVVEELAEKYADKAVIGKLNIDDNDEIASENRVRNIPTVLFFKDGELKDRSVGLVKLSDLEEKLAKIL